MRHPPDPNDPPYHIGYEDATDEIDDGDIFDGTPYYDITDDWSERVSKIYIGDEFWHTDERRLYRITDVKIRTRRHRSGEPVMDDGPVYIFYEYDWEPPEDPRYRHHRGPKTRPKMTVEEFDELVNDEEILVPHKGNGLPPLPP